MWQATFEDALLTEALAKKHSLTREAIEVRDMVLSTQVT